MACTTPRSATARTTARLGTAPRPLVLAVAVTGFMAAPATAQSVAFPGDRVRVLEIGSDQPVEGRLVAITGAGLAYQPEQGEALQLGPSEIASVEVVRRTSRWGTGLVVGAAAGAVIGAVWNPSADDTECATACPGIFGDGDHRLFSGVLGALAGGLAGGIVGSFFRTEYWEPVLLPWIMADGAGLHLRLPLSLPR